MVQQHPPRKAIRFTAACEKLGIGVSTGWLKVGTDPDFPKPFKLGARITVFYEHEIDAYLDRCAQSRITGAEPNAASQSPVEDEDVSSGITLPPAQPPPD